MQKLLSENKIKAAEARGRVVVRCARSLTDWTDAKTSDEVRRTVRQLMTERKQDEIESQLLRAISLIEAIRVGDLSEAANLAKDLQLDSLSMDAFGSIARNLLEALDGLATGNPPAWASSLFADSGQLIAMENSKQARPRAIALRWRSLQKDRYEESILKLRELSERNLRDFELQLMVAQTLASKDLKLSTEIATRVAASTPKGSDLFFAARWLTLRNQVKSGESEVAKKAAQLLIATYKMQPLWQSRFTAISSQ